MPFISVTADGPKHLEKDLTRTKFEELCSDLIERCKTPIEMSLKDAELTPAAIDQNVLVGGSTRIPSVQTLVERHSQLNACRYVDEIIPYQTEKDLEDILEMYHIDVRILGEEYREKDFTGRDICKNRGIQLHFNKRDHRFSSSDLRRRICNDD